MKIKQIDATAAFAWSHDTVPLLATGSIARSVDFDAPSSAWLQIWDAVSQPLEGAIFHAEVEHNFHALAWLKPFEGRLRGVIAGAFANGVLEFWDAQTLLDTKSLASASIHKYTGDSAVKCMQFNPQRPEQLATGDQKAQILIWDTQTFAKPTPLGKAISPMDEITLLAWNNMHSYILVSTSTLGYTSIWDLKQKKEVLHLLYVGANGKADFSHVAWHPTELTKLATASRSDTCAVIMTWNLRTPQEPEKILYGHTKGVLSLDWCAQDPNLLISAGKDNCTRLWNPVLGIKLGDYPTTANWAFLTRFAPRVPDLFATASFDGKVIIHTLQDTSLLASKMIQARDDNEFWSSITSVETQQAVFEVHQAPAWLKRPVSVSFAFGSRLVLMHNAGGKGVVQIRRFDAVHGSTRAVDELNAALVSNDYLAILAARLAEQSADRTDWELLSQLQTAGKAQFVQDAFGLESEQDGASALNEPCASEAPATAESNRLDDDFFSSLSADNSDKPALAEYLPQGAFSLSSADAKLAKLLLSNKVAQAVDVCLAENKVQEALLLVLNQGEAVQAKVKSHYFKHAGNSVLTRLLFLVLSRDVSDVVKNAEITGWRDIAASISAYCTPDSSEYNAKFEALGDRIWAAGRDSASRNNALYCYIAGSALDKVSAMWLQELSQLEDELFAAADNGVNNRYEARYAALNVFTQKVAMYRSLLQQTGPVTGAAANAVCEAIGDFATMISSAGNFSLALQLMALLPEDFVGVKAEKERIAQALRTTGVLAHKGRAQASYINGYSQAAQYSGRGGVGAKPILPGNAYGAHVAPMAPGRNVSVPTRRTTLHSSVDLGRGYRQNSFASAAPVAGGTRPANPYVQKTQAYGASVQSQTSYGALPAPTTSYGLLQPVLGPTSTPSRGPGSPLSQSGSKHKTDTDGWNDLPDAFKASAKPAARRTPAPQTASAALMSPQSKQATPPKLAPPGPPSAPPSAPMSGSSSRSRRTSHAANSVLSPITTHQGQEHTSRYAPFELSHGGQSFDPMDVPKPQLMRPYPPKNPYAPPPRAASVTGHSVPGNGFAPPMGPPAPAANAYAPAAGPPGDSTAGAAGNYGASMHPQGPNSLSGRVASQTDLALPKPPVNPYAVLRKPSTLGLPAQPSPYGAPATPLAPPKLNASIFGTPGQSPASHARPSLYSPADPGTPGPPGPPRPPGPQGPSGQKTGPSGPTAPSAPSGPPPRVAPLQPAPPGPPRPNPVQARSRAPSQAAGRAAPPGKTAPVQPGPGKPETTQITQTAQACAVDFSSIKLIFEKTLADIRSVAPEKYRKHIDDMARRLNKLYGQLEKGDKVSAALVVLLKNIASSLAARDFAAAHNYNGEIFDKHVAEVGDWGVGVKRLITMSEAVKDKMGS